MNWESEEVSTGTAANCPKAKNNNLGLPNINRHSDFKKLSLSERNKSITPV